MNSDINLLAKKEDLDLKKKQRVKLLKTISIVCLGITGFTIIILLILYSQLKISSIKKDQESAIKNMSFLHEKSAKLMTVNDRAAMITQVFKERIDFQQVVSEITKQLLGNIVVSGIDISKDGVKIRLSSTSLYDFKVFIDRMVSLAENKKIIKDLTIESFTYDIKNNKYQLVMSSNLL